VESASEPRPHWCKSTETALNPSARTMCLLAVAVESARGNGDRPHTAARQPQRREKCAGLRVAEEIECGVEFVGGRSRDFRPTR
jgi:hypothetical protein